MQNERLAVITRVVGIVVEESKYFAEYDTSTRMPTGRRIFHCVRAPRHQRSASYYKSLANCEVLRIDPFKDDRPYVCGYSLTGITGGRKTAFVCEECERVICWCFGTDEEDIERCDSCWTLEEMHADAAILRRYSCR